MYIRLMAILTAIIFLSIGCQPSPTDPTFTPPSYPDGLIAQEHMVVSAHPLASEVGNNILQNGGNAVDAMVGVHFTLAVVLPAAGNIGGGGFMVYRGKDGQALSLDFREMAPGAATETMYQDSAGEVIDSISYFGHLAAGVPGSVAGMQAAHDSLGNLPWEDLVAPAIELAEQGFPLTEKEADLLNEKLPLIRRFSSKPSTYTQKTTWQAGDTIRHPELAECLRRIQQDGNDGFYTGETASQIVAEMQRGGGIMTAEDLGNYQAIWRKPVTGSYKEYEVIGMPPPSSGGIALLQLLGIMEQFPLPKKSWHHPADAHLIIEAARRVYADRAKHLGDADFYPVPMDGLTEARYLKSRMKDYNPQQATSSDDIRAGNPAPTEPKETTHYSIVDKEGNAVSVTTTINGAYGSFVVVGGAGFLLNNEMDDFSSKPGIPNAYGLVGAEANAIAPGKRMLSSMTPTILTKDGELFMVVGTPGGSTIITSVFQTILNVVEYDMGMQAAVSSPRFHHQWLPNQVFYEEGAFSPAYLESLRKMGHELSPTGGLGRV
ncbi:MAG: gamma-glutamyltransferase, partial [Bacteroidota bacterium]